MIQQEHFEKINLQKLKILRVRMSASPGRRQRRLHLSNFVRKSEKQKFCRIFFFRKSEVQKMYMNFYRNQSNCLPFSVPMFPFSHLMINIILFSNQIIKRKLSKFRRDYQSLLQFAEILPIAGAKPGFQFLPPVGRDGMATEAKPEANRRTLFSKL